MCVLHKEGSGSALHEEGSGHVLASQTQHRWGLCPVTRAWGQLGPIYHRRGQHVGVPAGNKGAVGISFMFNGTSFGFVNCHLTSGSEKTAR